MEFWGELTKHPLPSIDFYYSTHFIFCLFIYFFKGAVLSRESV